MTTRLFFADGSALFVGMSAEDARRDVYVHHAVVDRSDPLLVRSVAFRKEWLVVPARQYGPLDGDLVHIDSDDVAGARASAARDLGQAEAERMFPDRAGQRYVAVFVEDSAIRGPGRSKGADAATAIAEAPVQLRQPGGYPPSSAP